MQTRLGHTFRLAVCVCTLGLATHAQAADQQARIQRVVDDLKSQLSIGQRVDVSVVEANPRLFSVVPQKHEADTPATFLLSVEEAFAQALSDAELRAAVAHELGHVWIFTHFPFLQTEELANDIASRIVSRDDLAPLYEKVNKRSPRSH